MKIVAISDQHGHLPAIPECDLLLVAGDNCPDFPYGQRIGKTRRGDQQRWFREVWLPWRDRQPAKLCFLTWGNHDFGGERLHAATFDRLSFGQTCAYVDELAEIAGLKVWLTPWSTRFMDWAFMKEEDELADIYARIPDGVDIIVSHQPPIGRCDAIGGLHAYDCPLRWHSPAPASMCTCGCETHLGSPALAAAIRRVRPRAVVCGHIHSGHGQERMLLQTDADADAGLIDGGYTWIYNVSVVDEGYNLVHSPTVIEL